MLKGVIPPAFVCASKVNNYMDGAKCKLCKVEITFQHPKHKRRTLDEQMVTSARPTFGKLHILLNETIFHICSSSLSSSQQSVWPDKNAFAEFIIITRRLLAFCSAVHVFNGVHAYSFRFWRANSTHNTITSKGCSSALHQPCHSLSL